jgi:hypothetical protein
MEKFRSIQRNKLHHYIPYRGSQGPENPWLLIPFVNQWFNVIDIRKVKAEVEYLNPYKTSRLGGYILNHHKN